MQTEYINNTGIIELYFNSNTVNNSYHNFKNELKSLISNENDLFDEIMCLNNDVFKLISELPLEKLFVSLTSSKSIFYRFTQEDKKYEFKLELFLDFNKDNSCDIESTLHVYQNGMKLQSYYGSLEEMYNLITKTYAVAEPKSFFSYSFILPVVNQYNSELGLSYAANPSRSFPILNEG